MAFLPFYTALELYNLSTWPQHSRATSQKLRDVETLLLFLHPGWWWEAWPFPELAPWGSAEHSQTAGAPWLLL